MKKSLGTIVKILISTLLIVFICKKVGLNEIVGNLTKVRLPFLIATLFAFTFSILKAYKWYYVLRLSKNKVRLWSGIKSYLLGMCFGLLTPARIGEAGRFINIEGKKKVLVMSLVGVDKIFDVLTVVFLCSFGVYHFMGILPCLSLVFIVSIMLLTIYYPGPLSSRFLILTERIIPSIRDKVQGVIENIRAIDRKSLIKFTMLTLSCYSIVIIEYYFLVSNFEPVPILPILMVQPLIMLTNILPITIGGLGVREGTAVILFSYFSISNSTAVNSAFMLFFLNTFLPGVIGSFIILTIRFSKNN